MSCQKSSATTRSVPRVGVWPAHLPPPHSSTQLTAASARTEVQALHSGEPARAGGGGEWGYVAGALRVYRRCECEVCVCMPRRDLHT
jgi:hypothetical protein